MKQKRKKFESLIKPLMNPTEDPETGIYEMTRLWITEKTTGKNDLNKMRSSLFIKIKSISKENNVNYFYDSNDKVSYCVQAASVQGRKV